MKLLLAVLTETRPPTVLATGLPLAVQAKSGPSTVLAMILVLAVLTDTRPSALLAVVLLLAVLTGSSYLVALVSSFWVLKISPGQRKQQFRHWK